MAYDLNNVFAKILREEIPCDKIYEDKFAYESVTIAAVTKLSVTRMTLQRVAPVPCSFLFTIRKMWRG